MENTELKRVEHKNEWVAPELKKVAIEDLTAHLHLLHGLNDDGGNS